MKTLLNQFVKNIFQDIQKIPKHKIYCQDISRNQNQAAYKQSRRQVYCQFQSYISNLKDMNNRNKGEFNDMVSEKKIKFVDMYKIFTKEKIGVKGSFNYKLKSIGKALHNFLYLYHRTS